MCVIWIVQVGRIEGVRSPFILSVQLSTPLGHVGTQSAGIAIPQHSRRCERLRQPCLEALSAKSQTFGSILNSPHLVFPIEPVITSRSNNLLPSPTPSLTFASSHARPPWSWSMVRTWGSGRISWPRRSLGGLTNVVWL